MTDLKYGEWYVDVESNRILANDNRKTIICEMANLQNPEIMEDARKLAAANEMLAALKAVAGWADSIAAGAAIFRDVRNAIAKAEYKENRNDHA